MTRFPFRLMAGGFLATSLFLLAVSGIQSFDPDDESDKKATEAAAAEIVQLADCGDDDEIIAKAIAKNHRLESVMRCFKPRDKYGIGVGPEAGAIRPDGIEAKLNHLDKRILSKADLAREAEALTRAARVVRAVSEVIEFYAPAEKGGRRGPKQWKEFNTNLRKSAVDLIDALQKGDPAQVKKAVGKLNHNCNECHRFFR